MHNITVISSFHKNFGKCNPDELIKIIEEIQPEIIFEELCIDTFNFVHANGYSPNTIEAIAIKGYLKRFPIKHFPVDTYQFNESAIFDGADEIAKRNPGYCKLWIHHISMITKYGFTYLNSNSCSNVMEKLRITELSVLSEINDEKLSVNYESERIIHDKREYEMIRNIYDYSKQIPYNRAIFICGIKHRIALQQKINEFKMKEKFKLNWTFYNKTECELKADYPKY